MPRSSSPLAALGFSISVIASAWALHAAPDSHWVGIWATAPMSEEFPAPLNAGHGALLREIVRLSHGAPTVRLHLSNEYGTQPLVLGSVHVALSAGKGTIVPGSDKEVLFDGKVAAQIPAGAELVSDALAFAAAANTDLSITIAVSSAPVKIAGHPGSRATSYVASPGDPAAVQLEGAKSVVHWYFLSGIDGWEPPAVAAVACLGDSFTDGHGVDPDQNTRWTDVLAHRLQGNPATADIAVLNLGIGGNRLLNPGLGPSGLSRLKRDVLDKPGVRWVILQLGVNDLGTRLAARKAGKPFASVDELIAGYTQVINACHDHSLKVALATISPFANAGWYSTPDVQADRMALNAWMRSARCDAVADFDAGLKDPSDPSILLPRYSSNDHLHPSLDGYREMAFLVPEAFFKGSVR